MLGVVTGATDHISYQTQLNFGKEALHYVGQCKTFMFTSSVIKQHALCVALEFNKYSIFHAFPFFIQHFFNSDYF